MTPAEIHSRLQAVFGDAILEFQDTLLDPVTVVAPARLHEVCRHLRDDASLQMNCLRLVTGVDRPPETIEVVYHLVSLTHHHGIVLRVRLPRTSPRVDSLADLWPAANWHEREQLDLFGIEFANHPDPRRLFMPQDWVGHPLLKDYERPLEYHGIPGNRELAKTHIVSVPTQPVHVVKDEELDGFMRINMGPHHPATHGVLNFLLETDGEIIRRARPEVGYLHRGLEKIGELTPYAGTMPYTDRIDYLGAMFTNHGWALAVERLAGISVPRRAEFCRVIASELNRIASHFIATGSIAMDTGAFTPFIHWLRERETVNDILERICGARLTYNYMRFGGVAHDIDAETIDKIQRWLDHFEPMIDEFNRLITGNEIFVRRLAKVTTISAADAIGYGIVGPNLRATGVPWDIRRDEPYSIYPEFDFDVIVGKGWRGEVGDAYDRFYCRVLEIRECVKILRQACAAIPAGEIRTAGVPRAVKPAANEVYTRVEGPRGEAGFYVVSDGSDKPHRARYRTGSFTAISIIDHISPGLMLADLVVLIGSLDVIAPEVDR
jgi:NADH-quinone oxidoreductase subunit D